MPTALRRPSLIQAWRDPLYLSAALPLGVLAFVVLITGLSVGIAASIAFIGLLLLGPLGTLVGTAALAHGPRHELPDRHGHRQRRRHGRRGARAGDRAARHRDMSTGSGDITLRAGG